MNNLEFVGGKEASKILGVHQRTLYQWEKKGKIETMRTPGGKRLYNVEQYINTNTNTNSNDDTNNTDTTKNNYDNNQEKPETEDIHIVVDDVRFLNEALQIVKLDTSRIIRIVINRYGYISVQPSVFFSDEKFI